MPRDPRPAPRTQPQQRMPRVPPDPIRVVLDEDLASGGTALATVYVFEGSTWIASPKQETVREILGVDEPIPATSRCVCLKFGKAGWCVIAANCPDEA